MEVAGGPSAGSGAPRSSSPPLLPSHSFPPNPGYVLKGEMGGRREAGILQGLESHAVSPSSLSCMSVIKSLHKPSNAISSSSGTELVNSVSLDHRSVAHSQQAEAISVFLKAL